MTIVRLVVTGDLEKAALGSSLQRFFPGIEFDTCWATGRAGFTSSKVTFDVANQQHSKVRLFARSLLNELDKDLSQGEVPADIVIGIDDLELENATQPDIVVKTLREAVEQELNVFQGHARDRWRQRVRQCVSFHLLAPLPEAYFYCENAALDRAGRVPGRLSLFNRASCDPEHFAVQDEQYLNIPEHPKRIAGTRTHDWRANQARRPQHPKKYLQYLADEHLDGKTRYAETSTGASALRSLDWQAVLSDPRQTQFLRSLFQDLATIAGPTAINEFWAKGKTASLTWPPSQDALLRNL